MGGRKPEPVFSVLSSDNTRSNGHKLKLEVFYLDIRNLFHCEGGQTVEQVSQKHCGAFIFGNTKTRMDKALSNVL